MGGVLSFLLVYIIGGFTFIPLVIAAVFCHAYLTFPTVDTSTNLRQNDDGPKDPFSDRDESSSSIPAELQKVDRERDAAAGYFAICREFVPGGVNGKPPERLTPAGEVIAVESPSVYQSMYRSLFERGKAQGSSLDGSNGNIKATKKARNVFYVVLRLGHLMLYDNAEQLEVRHVISLGLYEVDVYGGGDEIPEGELWVKRNCIRLRRKNLDSVSQDAKPYFFFGDNCSEKEDFFQALIQNQHRSSTTPKDPIVPLQFAPEDMVKLIQQLHASEETLQTRWFNALLGRLFLSLYKTADVQAFVLAKITKKLTRIQKPTFIEDIKVGRLDMGSAAPLFTNPKLRELTLDGELILEMDVKYAGNFKIETAATALIDLGQRFKVRKIDILLAVLCKSLEAHLLVKIKPPPSNRLWISFETIPKMELSIEPIVSSRHITYGIILRTIESKIREAMAETLVFPNWDDIPFHDTRSQAIRGGIWHAEAASHQAKASVPSQAETNEKGDDLEPTLVPKSHSTPSLVRRRPVGSVDSDKAKTINGDVDNGVSSSREGMDIRTRRKSSRSSSFTATSSPIVSMSPTHASAIRDDNAYSLQDAASAMKGLSSRSSSHSSIPQEAMEDEGLSKIVDELKVAKEIDDHDIFDLELSNDEGKVLRKGTLRSSIEGIRRPNTEDFEKKRQSIAANAGVATVAATAAATAAAKKWMAKRAAHTESSNASSDSVSDLSIPIGRGQPLPPPGTPLPGPPPVRKTWAAALGSLNRKKVGSPVSISHASNEHHGHQDAPPLPPRPSVESTEVPPSTSTHSRKPSTHSRRSSTMENARKRSATSTSSSTHEHVPDDVLIIKAPHAEAESESTDSVANVGEHKGVEEEADQVSQTEKTPGTASVRTPPQLPPREAGKESGSPLETIKSEQEALGQ